MMGIGFSELVVILVIIMIIFGAGKLPEIGSAFGKSIRNFKQSMKEAQEEDVTQQAAATEGQPAQLEGNKELSKEEQERLAREKAQAEGEAKDKAMKETAEAFTNALPRKGSYDFSKDVAEKKKA